MRKKLEKIAAKLGYKYFRYGIPFRIECIKRKKDIEYIKSSLSDSLSLEIYEAALHYRKTRSYKKLAKYHDRKKDVKVEFPSGHTLTFDGSQYFPEGIIQLSDDEVFVDGGGFIGDTALQFAKVSNGNFKKIYVFEPIRKQYKTIQQNIKSFGDKILAHNAGLSSTNEKVYFSDTMISSREATSNEDNKEEVQLVSLDSYLSKKERDEITYIKLDIEGVELKALQGMSNTIMNNKPKLAICIYHKPKDLWELPLFVKQLNPKYKLFIRQHHPYNETILYAIP